MLLVEFPDAEERRKVLEIHLRRRGVWSPGLDLDAVAAATENYNGLDLEDLVKAAVRRCHQNGRNGVTTADLLDAQAQIHPTPKRLFIQTTQSEDPEARAYSKSQGWEYPWGRRPPRITNLPHMTSEVWASSSGGIGYGLHLVNFPHPASQMLSSSSSGGIGYGLQLVNFPLAGSQGLSSSSSGGGYGLGLINVWSSGSRMPGSFSSGGLGYGLWLIDIWYTGSQSGISSSGYAGYGLGIIDVPHIPRV